MNQERKASNFKSHSQNSISHNFRSTSAEGLRRLALSYRNTEQGRTNFENFKNSHSNAKKPIDPRFRRVRPTETAGSAGTSPSISAVKMPGSYQPLLIPSAPVMASSVPNTPKRRSPSPRHRQKSAKIAHQTSTSPQIKEEKDKEKTISMEDISVQVSAAHAPKPRSSRPLYSARSAQTNPDQADQQTMTQPSGVKPPKKVTETQIPAPQRDVVIATATTSRTNTTPPRFSERTHGNGDVLNPQTHNPRNLEKYFEFMSSRPTLRVHRTRSAIALPVVGSDNFDDRNWSTQAVAGDHICDKCACALDDNLNALMPYEPPSMDELTETDLSQKFFAYVAKVIYLWVFYMVGCFLGVLIVSVFAWIVSNEVLWSWANQPTKVVKNNPLILRFLSYFGGTAIYLVNFIIGNIYKLFILPRNSVFGRQQQQEDDTSLWFQMQNYF